MSTDTSFGPLIRLWGIKRAQLPPPSASPELLTPFLTALLEEAVPFVDSVSPKSTTPSPPSPWKPKSTKSFPSSTAPVRLLERRIPASHLAAAADSLTPRPQLRDEVWACRISLHRDAAAPGTASWAEFRHAMKEAHAESEEAFTPTVVAARRAMTWDCAPDVPPIQCGGGQTWGKFTLCVEEMRHAVGRPVLKDRVFPVLQMTASVLGEGGEETDEFVVASVTVADFAAAPEAEHAAARQHGDAVVASYASVERIRRVAGGGDIEWIMATASDARGVLPMWVQTRAVPGQIAKDVGLFLAWVKERREKGKDSEREGEDGEDGQQKAVDASAHERLEAEEAREQKALRKGMGATGASLQ